MLEIKVEPTKRLWYNHEQSKGAFGCRVIGEDRHKVKLNKWGSITLVGHMPDLELYQTHEVRVTEIDSAYGIQYEFNGMNIVKPTTSEEQKNYLGTILTQNQVNNIFDVYEFPVDEIINNTFDYVKVKGLGAVTYMSVQKRVLDNFALFDLLVKLGGYGIKYAQIRRIYEYYKNAEIAIQKIEENPYILYQEVSGISFPKADAIAMSLGIAKTSQVRIMAYTQYMIEVQENSGNTYMPIKDIYLKVIEDAKSLKLDDFVKMISESSHYTVFGKYVALTRTYECECDIADNLFRLNDYIEPEFILDNNDNKIPNPEIEKLKNFDVDAFIEQQEAKQGFKYNELQKKPFHDLKSKNVILMTGYAGTGKSTTLDGICNMCDALGWDIWQFALSGKASDVIAQKTGRGASTMHRGLGFNPEGGFYFNKNNPMPFKVYVLDEASMVNIFLGRDWIEAIPDGAKVIIVGDIGQLEAIGAGAFFKDMIQSGVFATTELTEVYRQALESGILDLATKIRNGEKFIADNATGIHTFGDKKDCYIMCGDKTKTVKNIIKAYKSLLGSYDVEQIVILVPRKDIVCGTKNLNNLIQQLVNPSSTDKIEFSPRKDLILREDDRVINTTNNYKVKWFDKDLMEIDGSDVYNGEVGNIHGIIELEKDKFGTYVDFGKKIILYAYDDIDSVDLAYALTIHKFQGSQNTCVIFGLDSSHAFQATRALVYTAWTRPEEMFIACLDPAILNHAIDNNPITKKKTFLKDLLLVLQNKDKLLDKN